jgi:hypothetical protein
MSGGRQWLRNEFWRTEPRFSLNSYAKRAGGFCGFSFHFFPGGKRFKNISGKFIGSV